MLWEYLIFLALANCLISTKAANRHYFFEIQNISCIETGSEITKLKCSFVKVEKNIYSLNVDFLFVRQLSANAELAMKIHIQSPKSTKVVKFMDSKFNICDTLKRQNVQVPMVRSIFNEILQKSNLPYSCPIGKDLYFNMTDFRLTDSIFPIYTLYVNFNFTLNFINDNKPFAVLLLQGRTVGK